MTWLTPGLAAMAAAALIPLLVLLYFLKLRRREVEISSTFLWKKSIQDLQANAPFQKLRRNILLLLQLLVLAAGLLAIAQPELAAEAGARNRHIIVIDRSASMSATDAGDSGREPRLTVAKREAIQFIDAMREPAALGLGQRDEAMVIAFDAGAEVVQPWTSDKARLRAAIESIEPTDAPTLLDEAMRLTGAYAPPATSEDQTYESSGAAPVHVWSDGRIHDAQTILLPSAATLIYHGVGSPSAVNTGVTALRAERDFDDPSKVSIFVGLSTTARDPQQVEVELAIDNLITGVRAAPVSPATDDGPGVGGVVFTLQRNEGGLIRVRLTRDDALSADNTASLALAPAKRLAVALVAESDLFLQTALEGMTLSRLVRMTPSQFERAAQTNDLGAFDVIVLSGWAPSEPLPPGRYIVFGAAPVMTGLTRGAERTGPFIAIDWSREHPMFRFTSLDNLIIARDVAIEASEDQRVLARSDAGPIVIEATDRGVRAIVVSFEPAESNWPFDPGFVIALASAVRSLGDSGGAAAIESASPGFAVSTRVPTGVAEVELREPHGETRTLPVAPDGAVTFGPARRAGPHQLSWRGEAGSTDLIIDGRAVRIITVNLLNEDETSIAAAPTLELASRHVDAIGGADGAPTRRALWSWLLLAALALVMLEWFVYNKRVHV